MYNLRKNIESAINSASAENGSDTPDFILAEYLTDCLAAYDKAVVAREKWYRRRDGGRQMKRTIQQIIDADTGDSSLIVQLAHRGQELERELAVANGELSEARAGLVAVHGELETAYRDAGMYAASLKRSAHLLGCDEHMIENAVEKLLLELEEAKRLLAKVDSAAWSALITDLAEAKEDTARLDWLIAQRPTRVDIDAAMEDSK